MAAWGSGSDAVPDANTIWIGKGQLRVKPLVELSPPLPRIGCPNRDGERAALSDDDDQPLAAGDRGVEEIASQHGVVLGCERDHDGRVF